MDIQTRKIKFVQEFLKLQQEDVISQLEKILRKVQNSEKVRAFEPMTADELNKRIDHSLDDSKNGRLVEVHKLLSEVKKWG